MQVIGTRQYGSEFDVTSNTISISTSPTKIRLLEERHSCMLYNNSDEDIYLGGESVDVATGFPLKRNTYLALDMGAGEYYAIVATGPADLRVLEL